MKTFLKRSIQINTVFLLLLPFAASAHALPVDMTPAASAIVEQPPAAVTIRFSERVDVSASNISVTGPSGKTISQGKVHTTDAYTLSIPIKADGNGTYIVSWGTVSADDGHFTKGAFPFAAGKNAVIDSNAASSAEIVEVATKPEILAMTVELLGHGLLWAVLLLFAFAVRPLLTKGGFESDIPAISRVFRWSTYLGAVLILIGGIAQILVKAGDVVYLQSMPFLTAIPVYLGTAAGTATLVRVLAGAVFLTLFLFGKKAIFAAKKITAYEAALFITLCVFAYFRAKISHATSNPFHPDFSVMVNFFHLIEKDLWAGIVALLFALSLMPRLRSFFSALIPQAFAMLAIDFTAVSVTATYIVWLHLKSFDNLFSTQWGSAFLELLAVAVLMVGLRSYHVLARLSFPRFFVRFISVTLAAECAVGILVVFYSSAVIITSPPLGVPPTTSFTATSNGVSLTLARSPYEDGAILLTALGSNQKNIEQPVVTEEDESGTAGPVSLGLTERFPGGYVFPAGLLAGTGPFRVAVTVPQQHAYDANASFEIPRGAFIPPPGWESKRPLDSFTLSMIGIAFAAFIFGLFLYYFSKRKKEIPFFTGSHLVEFGAVAVFLACSFGTVAAVSSLRSAGLENPFKSECEGGGNMWHVMQPTKAGVPVAATPSEGCMWGMGNATYMFPDKREYEYLGSLAHAAVTLAPQRFVAGVPATLTVSLKEPDGTPAIMFVDMEKLLHVVIVSKDETVFAHIHPDDIHPITQQEIDASSFTLNYTFPKSGEYLISADYAHGLSLESKQFTVQVAGAPAQSAETKTYESTGVFDGYTVTLDHAQPIAGNVETLKYKFMKDGNPVTNIVPYLSAAMHISVVKNDFSAFLHIHGEVHLPGVPLPPIIVKNGQVIHSMALMVTPPAFGPNVEAHVIFPSPGLYTVWGQFKVGDKVIPTSFTVKVE